MHKKSILHGNIAQKLLALLIVFSALIALIGCSSNMVTAGKDGISIEAGDWIGKSDDGSFTMQFKIGTNGENIFIVSFSYPCGEKSSYVLPPNPIKFALNNSIFETTTTDYSDLIPKLVIKGKFVDSSQAEGSWEFFGYYDSFIDLSCPAASGTWKGSPAK